MNPLERALFPDRIGAISFDPWTKTADIRLRWGKLTVASFNRDPENRVKALRSYGSFDPRLAGRPDIWRNPESDQFELLDGGGRWWKAIHDGHEEREHGFVLHETQDRNEARYLCLVLNRKRMTFTRSSEFMSALREGDDIPVAINKEVLSLNLGYVLDERDSGDRGRGQLRGTTFLVPAFHYRVLTPSLTAASALGVASKAATDSVILFALGFIFLCNEDNPPDMSRMQATLANMGSSVQMKADARRPGRKESLRLSLARSIVAAYNTGIRASSLRQLRYPDTKTMKQFTALESTNS